MGTQEDIRVMARIIESECDALKALLLKKNEAYGNSAADPIQIFSKADATQQINVRIDDKLKRIRDGHEFGNEDTEMDLTGYLILKRCVVKFKHRKELTSMHVSPECFGSGPGNDSKACSQCGVVDECRIEFDEAQHA